VEYFTLMTRYRILPYRTGSKSAKALAEALGGKVLRLEGSTFKSRPGDVIVNWGNSDYPDFLYSDNYNCVPLRGITDKKRFFELMKDTGLTPEFWTTKEEIPNEKYPVVCRTILSGHSGAGIHIADNVHQLVDCQLYVRYVKKAQEYRVHLGRSRVDGSTCTIAVQRKARRLDHPNPDWQVRNHANGFVYVRSDVNPPDHVFEVARLAFEKTGLDFGAVDAIWNEQKERAYVLEINTAPGLEGTTVTDYAEFFRKE
jgi:hypothetical protein